MPTLDVTLMRELARVRFAAAPVPKGVSRDPYFQYLDAMASALRQAVDMWRTQAIISDVTIMGPSAFGGKITLPALDGLVRGFAPAGSWDPYSRAIAAGVHNQFRLMCSMAVFPGLPMYPAFAAFPAPIAPPMANVPTPLMTFVLPGLAQVAAQVPTSSRASSSHALTRCAMHCGAACASRCSSVPSRAPRSSRPGCCAR